MMDKQLSKSVAPFMSITSKRVREVICFIHVVRLIFIYNIYLHSIYNVL